MAVSEQASKSPRLVYSQSPRGGPSAVSPQPPRPRRAARACDRCRASKLRCQVPLPTDAETRCRNCARNDAHCQYSNPPPPQAQPDLRHDGDERMSRLEANVDRLLHMMEHRPPNPALPQQCPPNPPPTQSQRNNAHPALGGLEALSHFADVAASADAVDAWLPLEPVPTVSPQMQAPQPSVSPNTTCSDSRRPHTHDSVDVAQARPIPKVVSGRRMAAFTDPEAYEAPFRPLAYCPDTFRNEEMSAAQSEAGDVVPCSSRRRGDPIDEGVLTEDQARGLFDFFANEICFFMPMFHESFALSFDSVRHRSSFLFCTILAVASKYNSSDTASSDTYVRHPIDRDTWLQIRGMAMAGYVQAIISKVHCLEDVQATVLLCAWGLQDRGASPDPWMMTGSALRLAQRLGIQDAAAALAKGRTAPTPRLLSSWKTYLCLYAFDRFFTAGFGRPETQGFDETALDTTALLKHADCTTATVGAYVDLAVIATRYSRFVNVGLKSNPASCWEEIGSIGGLLDSFSRRWLWARSPTAGQLGRAALPIRMIYNQMRLCLFSIPLKPSSHPDSSAFLRRTLLDRPQCGDRLAQCLKKDFSDDCREDADTTIWHAYDFAFMVLSHSAAVLLSLATTRICGSVDDSRPGVNPSMVLRYCGMAIATMIESNRSANMFPCDMARNLFLIVRETDLNISDWISPSVLELLSQDQDPPTAVQGCEALTDFLDIEQFLQPGFFDDISTWQL